MRARKEENFYEAILKTQSRGRVHTVKAFPGSLCDKNFVIKNERRYKKKNPVSGSLALMHHPGFWLASVLRSPTYTSSPQRTALACHITPKNKYTRR